ncbi:MAG: MATE family efflux transporter [Microthrixaceae bacterium]|nr:MATE family efflux transporter [Microthrixaceae bacterium]
MLTLASEPLYLLVDTAIVGHIGTAALGGLAVGSTVLLFATGMLVFLTFGTAATVARLLGAGQRARRRRAVRAGPVVGSRPPESWSQQSCGR